MLAHDHDIWTLLFEQTPVIFRWVMSILTLGLFLLAQQIWINHKKRIDKLEVLIIAKSDKTDENIKGLHENIDKFILTIIKR